MNIWNPPPHITSKDTASADELAELRRDRRNTIGLLLGAVICPTVVVLYYWQTGGVYWTFVGMTLFAWSVLMWTAWERRVPSGDD